MNEDKVREALKLLEDRTMPFDRIAILLKEALPPEPRFYKGQQVLVHDGRGNGWVEALFQGYQKTRVYPFIALRKDNQQSEGWAKCKPDPDAESLINWIEHDGSKDLPKIPANHLIVVIFDHETSAYEENPDGMLSYNSGWINGTVVVRYAIIPLPEYL